MSSFSKLRKITVNIPTLPLSKCIGKTVDGVPGMLTHEHCRIVGHVARIFRRSLPSYIRNKLPRLVHALCALHDTGKVSPGFLKKIYGPSLAKIDKELYDLPDMFETRHAAISESDLLFRYWNKTNGAVYASTVGAHHGLRDAAVLNNTHPKYGGPEWAILRQKLIDKLVEEFGNPYLTDLNDYDVELISGFMSLCDWIGSDEHFFSQTGKIKDIHRATLKAIQELGWKKTIIRPNLSFKELFGFDPRPEQKSFIDVVKKPGVYVLEASTGSGKTEAALAAAYNLIAAGYHSGLYFALPTRITSHRIFLRVQKFLEKAFEKGMAPHLIHGQAFISDIDIGGGQLAPGGMWFSSNRRALLLPFGIGTIDQILMSTVHAKFNFVRTLGLANKVIIIDELHSYDVYTGKLTDYMVKKLRALDCTVIVLSATLTHERKKQLLGDYESVDERYPLITHKTSSRIYTRRSGEGEHKNVKVRKVTDNYTRLFKEAEKRVLEGQQVLWVLNTVDRATAVYEHMRDLPSLKGLSVGLIHSRFPAIYRNKLEDEWMERLGVNGDRSKGSLLVSTQVLEQSADVDADFLITDIAPSDFIIQRIGRLFRHNRKTRPCSHAEAWIVCPPISGVKSRKDLREALGIHARIYSDYILWRTYRTWKRRSVVSVPDDLRKILEETYRDALPQDPTWVREAWEALEESNFSKNCQAKAATGSHVIVDDEEDILAIDVTEDDEAGSATRLCSVPTTQLLLLDGMVEYPDTVDLIFIDGEALTVTKGKKSTYVAKKVMARMTKVPTNKILKGFDSPDWLQNVVFGRPVPVVIGADTKVRLLTGADTGYVYKKDCGVYKPITI